MAVSKLNPWNWFKKENEQQKTLPVKQTERGADAAASPLDQFHAEFDRLVNTLFSGFGVTPPDRLFDNADARFVQAVAKPRVDVYGTDDEYVIEAELPGMEEQDLSLEIRGDVLILSAEKRRESRSEDKGYYRLERSYGAFRRVLDIPDDADRDGVSARLDKGVLRVTLPRTAAVDSGSRRIAIQGGPSA